jgi:hypothetical protein
MITTRSVFRLGAGVAAALTFGACDDGTPTPLETGPAASVTAHTYDLRRLPRSRIGRPPTDALPRPSASAAAIDARRARASGGKKSPALANGSFELNGGEGTSLLTGWTVVDIPFLGNPPSGSWVAQRGEVAPISGITSEPPTDGSFAAMSDQTGPGGHILYQDVTVPAHGKPVLSFDLYLANQAGGFATPTTLSPDGEPNQQFRMDIMDPDAPLDDLGAGVLRRVYRTEVGDPAVSGYLTIQTSLTEFAGRTVRLRFVEVDNQFFFEVGVDRVNVGKKPHRRHPTHDTDGKRSAKAEAIPFAPEPAPTAHRLTLPDDGTTGPIPIGFELSFFGQKYSAVNISSNGFVGFDADMSQGCCSGGALPSDDGVNNIIALAWTDLYPPGGGEVTYELRGRAPHRRLVISYEGLSWCCELGGNRLSSQLILFEAKGRIEIHTAHQDPGHFYTQGVENGDGTVAASLPGRVAADYGLENDGVRFTTR